MPQHKTSRPRYFIGGYACDIVAGAVEFALLLTVALGLVDNTKIR
jgi:hypothetical protein